MALEAERKQIQGSIVASIKRDEDELARIETELKVQRERLLSARQEGDLSENAEYQTAYNEIERLEVSKVIISNRIKSMQSASHVPDFSGYIGIGSMVHLVSSDNQIDKTFLLVKHDLSNALEGRVSINSVVGEQLIGKRVGDKIFVTTSAANIMYTIKEVG